MWLASKPYLILHRASGEVAVWFPTGYWCEIFPCEICICLLSRSQYFWTRIWAFGGLRGKERSVRCWKACREASEGLNLIVYELCDSFAWSLLALLPLFACLISPYCLFQSRTWSKTIPGKVEFFSSEGSDTSIPIPIVPLPGVDDSYPPQKKSFMMLKYMHDHYLDKYEWFMRADDDVYIKGDKLENFLRSLNSSEPLFLGQTGLGTTEEMGKLALEPGENFCMGGPGVIMSREVLRRMVPHIGECLREMYTTHEDVEVGRCVRRFAGVQCVWSYEVRMRACRMRCMFWERQRRGWERLAAPPGLLLNGCAAGPPELASLCNLTVQLYGFYSLCFLQASPWERPTWLRRCNSNEGSGTWDDATGVEWRTVHHS